MRITQERAEEVLKLFENAKVVVTKFYDTQAKEPQIDRYTVEVQLANGDKVARKFKEGEADLFDAWIGLTYQNVKINFNMFTDNSTNEKEDHRYEVNFFLASTYKFEASFDVYCDDIKFIDGVTGNPISFDLPEEVWKSGNIPSCDEILDNYPNKAA